MQQQRKNLAFAAANRTQIEDIKRRYLTGRITREQAQSEADPVIERINSKGEQIAKKWNKKYSPVSFIGLMR